VEPRIAKIITDFNFQNLMFCWFVLILAMQYPKILFVKTIYGAEVSFFKVEWYATQKVAAPCAPYIVAS
jgi:hypothetical protein